MELANVIPVYVVKNIHNFTSGDGEGCFRDTMIVRKGSTFNEVAQGNVLPEMHRCVTFFVSDQWKRNRFHRMCTNRTTSFLRHASNRRQQRCKVRIQRC